jgi:hypothetical protein
MDNTTIEWAVFRGNIAVISDDTGKCRFLDLDGFGGSLPFSSPMTGPGSRGSTAALLTGAVALGLDGHIAALRACATSLGEYVLDLIGSYHNSRRTVPNYLKAARRFRRHGRLDIASYLERHAREENGHERLALRDLQALNLPAERIVEKLIPDGVASLCDLFDRLSSADYPIGCIGYSYFFESSAATRQKADVDALQALCPKGVDATRFMRAHSSLASEVDHVRDMVNFIAGLPAQDRIEIAKAAHATAATALNALSQGSPKSELEIWAEIREVAGEEMACDYTSG